MAEEILTEAPWEGGDVAALPPAPAAADDSAGSLRLAWRALLLDDSAYAAVRDDRHAFRRGFVVLLTIMAVDALAYLLALAFDSVTAIRTERIQQIIYNFVVSLPWYTDQLQSNPNFAAQFQQNYFLGWEGGRIMLGLPSGLGTTIIEVLLVVSTLSAWLTFGFTAHWLARWFGGKARFGQFMGVFGLAYAPLMLSVITIIPGAYVTLPLLFFALLVTKFIAVKQAHRLTTGYTLAAILGAYLIWLLIYIAVAFFASAYGTEYFVQNSGIIDALRNFAGSLPFVKP